jgi:hypothetical protein
MIVKPKHDHNDDRDHNDRRDHDNDNERAVAPAPSGGALASLAALGKMLNATFKPTTVGGIQSVASLIEEIRDRINGGQHDGKVSPIVLLKKDSYQHPQYGRVWTPRLDIVDWMTLGGPAPAPVPTSPPPTEQPRRRRVA